MSLEINQIALHQLIKRDEQTLEVVLRDSLLLEPTHGGRRNDGGRAASRLQRQK